MVTPGGHDDPRMKSAEVVLELVGGVVRVQRHCGRAGGDAVVAHRDLGTPRHDDDYAVAAPDPEAVQGGARLLEPRGKIPEPEGRAARGQDRLDAARADGDGRQRGPHVAWLVHSD